MYGVATIHAINETNHLGATYLAFTAFRPQLEHCIGLRRQVEDALGWTLGEDASRRGESGESLLA
jgi:hypothetical protein